jgi:hypothetical protein
VGKQPYWDASQAPPYRGPRNPPVQPGPDGHFDYLTDCGSREFMAAHMYGTVRFVLDVWERYFGGPVPWHFAADHPRLELVPLADWDNAHSGYGFIETGYSRRSEQAPQPHPFCLNFDVLAHELGHSFIYSLLGVPPAERVPTEYLAFHESAADCVAMIAMLDFDSTVDRMLVRSRGNIYLPNELNRIGELSETTQIRLASNSLKLQMSLPLTGAVFDILVDVFQNLLVEDGLISRELDSMSRPETRVADETAVQAAFDRAYRGRHNSFKRALLDARDYLGKCLAMAWRNLTWASGYADVAKAMLDADARVSGGAGREIILESLLWRGIKFPFRSGQRAFSERANWAQAMRW